MKNKYTIEQRRSDYYNVLKDGVLEAIACDIGGTEAAMHFIWLSEDEPANKHWQYIDGEVIGFDISYNQFKDMKAKNNDEAIAYVLRMIQEHSDEKN